MDEEFYLKWNNHQSTIISVFDKLLENEKHVDCTLAAEGQILRAHKVVLSACSPYFEELLNLHQDKHPILIFNDVKYYELKGMLDYMYRGEVHVLQEQLQGFLKAAESLQIKGLSDKDGGDSLNDFIAGRTKETKRKVASLEFQYENPKTLMKPPKGSTSPIIPNKRQKRRRPSYEPTPESNVDGHCDTPAICVTNNQSKTDKVNANRVTQLTRVKAEPIDGLKKPKTEYSEFERSSVEDLTLDDDDDDDLDQNYMIKPGTSRNDDQSRDWNFKHGNEDYFMEDQDEMNEPVNKGS